MKNKDITSTPKQKLEEAKDYAHELSDEELDEIAGGININDRINPPSNDGPNIPPIEKPFLEPFA